MNIVLQPPIRVAILAVMACCAQDLRCEAADLAEALQPGSAGLEKVAASWSVLPGAAGGQMRREWKPADRVFGARVARALATFSGAKLEKIDVMYADATALGAAYAATAAQLKLGLPPAIDKALGVEGLAVPADATLAAGSVVVGWSIPTAQVRLVFEQDKRVWMTLTPVAGGGPAMAQVPTGEATAAGRPAGPNEFGDVKLPKFPIPVRDADDALPASPVPAKWLLDYYGLPVTEDDLLKLMPDIQKDEPEATSYREVLLVERALKEKNGSFKEVRRLDPGDVMREIDQGNPVLVSHSFREKRHTYLADFQRRIEAGGTELLPPPTDKEEKEKWASVDDDGYAGISMVVGYNKTRGEVLLTMPQDYGLPTVLRMRWEELQHGCYFVCTFTKR